jgi:histidyl-tRNA synthetase
VKLRAVRGMNDILPDEVTRWHRLESEFRRTAELYGYGEIRTPLLEATALFAKQIGETTDVVEKEMYSFERHGDELTVRPEGTASVARAYVEHNLANKEPISRFYYLGPMFRGERPAKGRFRQFHQAGCELFGDAGPVGDAELVELAVSLLARLGIDDVVAHINSLGSGDTRARYRQALSDYFTPLAASLSEDSQRRLEKNPLRILDSKVPQDQELAKGAPTIVDLLTDEDRAHFEGLKAQLEALDIRYVVDTNLVRGLDYYTRTLFELKSDRGDLGAQNTLCGGGRYDGMVESLGGPSVPAIGFAMGLERILTAMPDEAATAPRLVYAAILDESARGAALTLARELRALGVQVDVDGRSVRLKAMIRRADALGCRLCLLFGAEEVQRGAFAVKDLSDKSQVEMPLEGAARVLADRVRGAP